MIRACVICLKPFESALSLSLSDRITPIDETQGSIVCSSGCRDELNRRIEDRAAERGRDFYTAADEDHSGETEAERARKAAVESRSDDLAEGIAHPEARLWTVRAAQRILEAVELLEHPDIPPRLGLAATAGLLAARLLVEAYGEKLELAGE